MQVLWQKCWLQHKPYPSQILPKSHSSGHAGIRVTMFLLIFLSHVPGQTNTHKNTLSLVITNLEKAISNMLIYNQVTYK